MSVVANDKPASAGNVLSEFGQVKELNTDNFGFDELVSFIGQVQMVFDANRGLQVGQAPIFNARLLGVRKFTALDIDNPEPAEEDRGNYLFPSDLARFLVQAAEKTRSLANHLDPNDSLNLLSRYSADEWKYYLERWGRAEAVAQDEDGGNKQLNEAAFYQSNSLHEMDQIIDALVVVRDLLDDDRPVEKVERTGPEETYTAKSAPAGVPSSSSTTTGESDPDPEGDGEAGDPDSDTPMDELVEEVTPEERIQLTKEVSYETAWVYNRLLFELFTSKGIDIEQINQVSPLLLSELYKTSSNEVWQLTPSQLARLFASPSARFKILQEVYEAVSQNPRLVSLIYRTYSTQKAEERLRLQIDQDEADAGVPLNFGERLKDELLNADETSPDRVFEQKLNELIGKIGANPDGLPPNINPDLINAKNQVEFLLRNLGVSQKDLVEALISPESAGSNPERVLAVIDGLSTRHLWQILFPHLEIEGVLSIDVEQRRRDLDAKFEPFRKNLLILLKGYLRVKAAKIGLVKQNPQANQALATETVADQIVEESAAKPNRVSPTLSTLRSSSLSSNPKVQDEEDEINSKRSGRLDGRSEKQGAGKRYDAKHKELAGYIATYQRAWEFLPNKAKLVAYQQSGLLDSLPLNKTGYDKNGIIRLTGEEIDKLISDGKLALPFDGQVFFGDPLETVLIKARKQHKEDGRKSSVTKSASQAQANQRDWASLSIKAKLRACLATNVGPTSTLPANHNLQSLLRLSEDQLQAFEATGQLSLDLPYRPEVLEAKPLAQLLREARREYSLNPEANIAIAEAINSRSEYLEAVRKSDYIEAERQKRLQTYIKQLGEQRQADIVNLARARMGAELERQRQALVIQEQRQRNLQAVAQQFVAQRQAINNQAQALESLAIQELSLQDIVSADANLDASGGQKLSLRERFGKFGAGSAGSRLEQMQLQTARKRMGEAAALKLLSQAGWQGKVASFAIKNRKKIAAAWLAGAGALTSLIISQIMKYGKVALNGAIYGGLGGAASGAWLGVQIGGAAGAFFGGIGAPIGAVIGGVVGGITGGIIGAAGGSVLAVKVSQAGGVSVGLPLKSASQAIWRQIMPQSPSSLQYSGTTYAPSATTTQGLPVSAPEPLSATARGLPGSAPEFLPTTGGETTPSATGITSSPSGAEYTSGAPSQSSIYSTPPNIFTTPPAALVAGYKALGTWAAGSGIGVTAALTTAVLIIMSSVYTMYIIFGAFLVPLPVGDSSDRNTSQSKYVSITKKANPDQLENDHGSSIITYTVTIKPKPSYAIKITSLTDQFSNHTGASDNSPPTRDPNTSPLTINDLIFDPTVADPLDYDPFISKTTTAQYEVTLTGGRNTQVRNRLDITFEAYKISDPTKVVATETQSTIATVDIGEPKVFCWPVSGEIYQLPWESYTHSLSDAIDIAAPLNRVVRAPFKGTLIPANVSKAIYGPYPVFLRFTHNGQERNLLFGHLRQAEIQMSNASGKEVNIGDPIGIVGNKGVSTGPHLHYALMDSKRYDGGLKLLDLIPAGDINIALHDQVTSCLK